MWLQTPGEALKSGKALGFRYERSRAKRFMRLLSVPLTILKDVELALPSGPMLTPPFVAV